MQKSEKSEENKMSINESEIKNSKNPSHNPSENKTQTKPNTKELKPKAERLQEGINILNKLKETGVEKDESFDALKKVISEWVNTGEYWSGSIPFPQYGKVVTGHLPRYKGQAPMMVFKLA